MGVLWDNRQIISGNVARIILFFAFFIMRSFAKNSSFNATFIFGDSLVDAGNNNYIVTLAKANYIPNGIDFGMPTGRFTNNRTCADIIGKFLCFFFSSSFLCNPLFYIPVFPWLLIS